MNNNILHKLFLTLTLVLLTLGASAQVTVSGNVSDESGEPIIGATVMEALTTNGVVTDFDGNFKIQVKNENATLKISYIGMVAQNIRVGNQRNIKVVLKDESQKINEVVVVGYGHQKKESVVGAISQVSSDDLLNTPTANVTQAIAGKIPGVVTTQVSGAPGADDATINIRGRATFAGDGAPLVMVDGVERAFSQVAPDDIESIAGSDIDVVVGGGSTLIFVTLGVILFDRYKKDYLFNGLFNKAFFYFSLFFSASMVTVALELYYFGAPFLLTWFTTAVGELASLLIGSIIIDKLGKRIDLTK